MAMAVLSPVPGSTTRIDTRMVEQVRAMIEASLVRLGVRFDVWKSEASLHDEGWVARAVDRLRAAGATRLAGRWLHSDFKNVALPYVTPFYTQMIKSAALR